MKISIDVPDDIYREAAALAAKRHISVEQLFESMAKSHLQSWRLLEDKASRGDLTAFRNVMGRVPDVEPDDFDRL